MNEIKIEDYNYILPDNLIAQTAIEPRDASKLLVYKKNGIQHSFFNKLDTFIPENAQLFFNNAKVIPARIFLSNENNANIEVFLLQPFKQDYFSSLNNTEKTKWECLIGNKKKWDAEQMLSINIDNTIINFFQKENNVVEISWNSGLPFVEILNLIGKMPLPPYIKRTANENDISRYQTIYSKNEGSVAAPTAGLHFTISVLDNLKTAGATLNYLTLHVSAGTFLPVKVENAADHDMHKEYFSINKQCLENILKDGSKIAVGTTSIRVLESIYWCGVKLYLKRENPFIIEKLIAYQLSEIENLPNLPLAITTLIEYLEKEKKGEIEGETSILIMPGYQFKIVEGLITNFHQPKSTLILLIAALVGEDWRKIYNEALKNNYRFLSYGDSSLLLS